MKRRAFLSCATAALPVFARGAEQLPNIAGKATLVRFGHSQLDEVWQLGDRSFLHVKLAGSGESSPLIVEQSELRRFGPPRHVHDHQDEWFYPLDGSFIAEVGDERFELHAGDFLFAPRGIPHVWMHVEEEPGRLLIGFEPGGMMMSFFRRFTLGGALPPPDELPALFLEHGMKIVGPALR